MFVETNNKNVMKKIKLLLIISLLFGSCNKENVKPTISNRLEASITFTAPYVGKLYLEGFEFISIEVEGQYTHEFKSYLHQCNSKSFGYFVNSINDIEYFEYRIKADGVLIEKGALSFKVKKEKLVK